MTAEPRVEDLLASIRKAIDDDTSAEAVADTANARPAEEAPIKASMREMRVQIDEPAHRNERAADRFPTPEGEIEEIRARVDRNMEQSAAYLAQRPELRRPTQPSNAAFSSILTGRDRPATGRRYDAFEEPPAPPLRQTLSNEHDYDDLMNTAHRRPRDEFSRPYDSDWNRPAQRALMSQQTSQSAQMSFERLAETIMARAGGDRTIEDITRELLRGYLRQWLDDHLPALVERLVREEIERVARRGR